MTERMGFVHSTESFGSVDGPGVRFVIFLQGCRMRCQFCHNPDTWRLPAELALPGEHDLAGAASMGGSGFGAEGASRFDVSRRTADELLAAALRYKSYWKKDGGITVSGGEPLLQLDFLLELFKKAKAAGVHTALDTSGNPFTRGEPFFSRFRELLEVTDLVLLDIKEIDKERHRRLTGQTNENILDMARYLSEIGKPMWIRHVLVPERSDFDEDLRALADFIGTLKSVERVEVLPYHTLGAYKWAELGMSYPLEGICPPTPERVEHARGILEAVPDGGMQAACRFRGDH